MDGFVIDYESHHQIQVYCLGMFHIIYNFCINFLPNKSESIKSTDKGLFTKNNVLWSVMENAGCQMLYWLVVTRLCNTRSLVECSHVKTMLGQ